MENVESKNAKINGDEAKGKKKIIRIQVSKTKKPLFFYLNLAKKYIKQDNDVELSALGMDVMTSTIGDKVDKDGRRIPKAKIGILLGKAQNTDAAASKVV
ncbi:hypothetical protein RJT34_05170 [Clitoria ternatea]|uniref:Uncharacterized protein n=1 Tax=Clitoria ternatea TaxID=43366 RepID=A0AAN9PTH1_CLITE